MSKSPYVWLVIYKDNNLVTVNDIDIESVLWECKDRDEIIAIIRQELA